MRFRAILFIVLFPTGVFSQGMGTSGGVPNVTKPKASVDSSGHAFTYRPVSQEEYAKAIETCDRKVLRVSCTELLKDAQTVFTWRKDKLNTLQDLASYVRAMPVTNCQSRDSVTLSRVRLGKVDHKWSRPFRKGEQCLYDNNEGKFLFSLSCGNTVVKADDVSSAMAAKGAKIWASNDSLRRAHERIDSLAADGAFRGAGPVTVFNTPNPLKVEVEVKGSVDVTGVVPISTAKENHSRRWVVGMAIVAGAFVAVECIRSNCLGRTREVGTSTNTKYGPVNAPNGLRVGISMPMIRP